VMCRSKYIRLNRPTTESTLEDFTFGQINGIAAELGVV
jgi:hypothetical protein